MWVTPREGTTTPSWQCLKTQNFKWSTLGFLSHKLETIQVSQELVHSSMSKASPWTTLIAHSFYRRDGERLCFSKCFIPALHLYLLSSWWIQVFSLSFILHLLINFISNPGKGLNEQHVSHTGRKDSRHVLLASQRASRLVPVEGAEASICDSIWVHQCPWNGWLTYVGTYHQQGHLCWNFRKTYCMLLSRQHPESLWIFQEDNARPFSAHATKAWLHGHRVCVLDWLACSPYLFPIEIICCIMKWRIWPTVVVCGFTSNWTLQILHSWNTYRRSCVSIWKLRHVNWTSYLLGQNISQVCLYKVYACWCLHIPHNNLTIKTGTQD